MKFILKNIKGSRQNHQAQQDPGPNHRDHKDESHQEKEKKSTEQIPMQDR